MNLAKKSCMERGNYNTKVIPRYKRSKIESVINTC